MSVKMEGLSTAKDAEARSGSLADQRKASVEEEPGTENASGTTGTESNLDRNITDESTEYVLELTEKRYNFLRKYFDQLRAYGPLPNWFIRFGHRTTSKPPEIEDIRCMCRLNNSYGIGLGAPQLAALQARVATESKSKDDPFSGHTRACSVGRMNRFFKRIARYFTRETMESELFVFEPNSCPDYEKKMNRILRKSTLLMMRDGLDESMEEWSYEMSEEEIAEWRSRNKVREYVCFLMKEMLENLIGPSPPESEESSDNDEESGPEMTVDEVPQEEAYDVQEDYRRRYRAIKADYKSMEKVIEHAIEERNQNVQAAVLEGRLYEMRTRRAIADQYPSPVISSGEEELNNQSMEMELSSSETGGSDMEHDASSSYYHSTPPLNRRKR